MGRAEPLPATPVSFGGAVRQRKKKEKIFFFFFFFFFKPFMPCGGHLRVVCACVPAQVPMSISLLAATLPRRYRVCGDGVFAVRRAATWSGVRAASFFCRQRLVVLLYNRAGVDSRARRGGDMR